MTAPYEDIYASHIGIVVGDFEAVGACYQKLLGVPRWYVRETVSQPAPWDRAAGSGRLRIAYGRTPGQTIELIQPLEGETFASIFLRERGEGMQHLGFWVPDLQEAVRQALERGATLSHAGFRPDGSGFAQFSAASSPEALIGAIDADRPAFVDPGIGGMQVEFTSPSSIGRKRELMGDDFLNVFDLPPWERGG